MLKGQRLITWTREEIVAAIKAYHAATGDWPVQRDCCRANGLPAASTVEWHLGTLEDACRAAGRAGEMSQPPRWNAESIVAAIQAFHAETGDWPKQIEFGTANHLPAAATVEYHLGSLVEARRKAGMPEPCY